MKIIPFQKLADIPTGNPYKGREGLVDLGPEQSTMDVAELFPFHTVAIGWRPAATNITSHILDMQIRVGYHANNMISEIEILTPDPRIPKMKLTKLMLGNNNVFGRTLAELKSILEADNFELVPTDEGFDLKDGSVSFYSHDYEDDLNIKLDTVVLRFSQSL